MHESAYGRDQGEDSHRCVFLRDRRRSRGEEVCVCLCRAWVPAPVLCARLGAVGTQERAQGSGLSSPRPPSELEGSTMVTMSDPLLSKRQRSLLSTVLNAGSSSLHSESSEYGHCCRCSLMAHSPTSSHNTHTHVHTQAHMPTPTHTPTQGYTHRRPGRRRLRSSEFP